MTTTARLVRLLHRMVLSAITVGLLMMVGLQPALGQNGAPPPFGIFQNYFVTGDYVVAGWVKGAPDGSGFASGTISVPDTVQQPYLQPGVPASVPKGAKIVAAYLYWATVEGNQTSFAGQSAFFTPCPPNSQCPTSASGYAITGTLLGNPNAPTSWSAGGCSGSSQGSKTMRTYRADVRPYLPLDTDPASSTYGATIANGKYQVRMADSGSNGNTVPIALGATLVIIYRVLSPAVPLNAIVLYDGVLAPSNAGQNISQTISGFYGSPPPTSPVLHAKITHIVANGQANKNEQVSILGNSKGAVAQTLLSPYGSLPPFPGIYGTWDNPTWVLSNVTTTDTAETTSILPAKTNSGCVSWGAMILSTTVQDTDGDGLLDVWETPDANGNIGYTDAVSQQWVALPGADPNRQDIFVELDYFTNLDGSAGPYLHSHLPKRDALDAVGALFANQGPKPVAIHFDLGPGFYENPLSAYYKDPYVIQYPIQIPSPLPPGTLPPQAGTGGNAIPEGQLLCTDGVTVPGLCAFPFQSVLPPLLQPSPAVSWKGGIDAVKNSAKLGNFQPGRSKSYHYMLLGHSLGQPRSFWSTKANKLANGAIPQLVSIMESGNTATIKLQSPQSVIKPGDCPNAALPKCNDASSNRISISGALGQTSLNGSYHFTNVTTSSVNNISTTTFTITTLGVADGTYIYDNEPQLAVAYLGPSSSSGHSDFPGGGDSMVTFGLWGAEDPANCQPDPSQPLTAANPVYCSNQVGTIGEQTGTILHELGHTLSLAHGGTTYKDPNNPSVPTYGLNCAPNYLSVMNYLFQLRGFVDGGFDYSFQTLPQLNEAYPFLNESTGLGTDANGKPPAHITRWYASPNASDVQLQNTSGGRYAAAHCDGTPLLPNEPPAVRVDGTSFSAPLDWNNDLITPDQVLAPGEDLNRNGIIGDPPFSGFNDWPALNLQQINARAGAFGSSGSGGDDVLGGGDDVLGGGDDVLGGGDDVLGGGGKEQNEETATSTADSPTALKCTVSLNGVPGCVASSGGFLENGKSVPLTWTAPGFGQTHSYIIWRAVGSFTPVQIISNPTAFSVLKTLNGTPPSPSYIDPDVKNGVTYTYFVTDKNKQGAQSGPTGPIVVTVKF